LLTSAPEALLPEIIHAGAVFLGAYAPEAIGDYVAGPSHVLPTSRAARYASGLSVLSFLKRSSVIGCGRDGFRALANTAGTLADAEGLQAHALSIRLRAEA
jgi:histidinol dehydrogenase